MDAVYIGSKPCSFKTGSDKAGFTIQPYGVPAKIPLWLVGLGIGAAALGLIAAVAVKKRSS